MYIADMMWDWFPWLIVLVLTYALITWHWRQIKVPDIARKWVVVTGCDSGFGNLLVKRLDALGFNVVAMCLTVTGQDELKSSCSSRVHTCYLDVKHADSVQKALAFVENTLPKWEGLWGLVNNAGISGVASGPIEWLRTEDFREVFEVNTLGLIDVTLALLPLLKKGKGRVVCMSSASGRRLAGPLALPYDISKCAVEAFSDGLRRHLRLYNHAVSVHIVEPGIFKTPMNDLVRQRQILDNTWSRLPHATKEQFGTKFYKEYLKRSLDVVTHMAAKDLTPVMDVCEHALTAKSPKLRYPVGFDALMFSVPMSYLPSAVVDWIMCKLTPTISPSNDVKS